VSENVVIPRSNTYTVVSEKGCYRFLFKQHTLKKEKKEWVYQGNCLRGKRTKGSGMARRNIQWQEKKTSSLASIARKKGMMRTIVGNCIPRRDKSGSKKGKGGKQLQQHHDQQTWDRIQVMNLKSHWLV
jgi:hypothetical protein